MSIEKKKYFQKKLTEKQNYIHQKFIILYPNLKRYIIKKIVHNHLISYEQIVINNYTIT